MSRTEKLFSRLSEMVGEPHVVQDPDKLKAFRMDGKSPKVVVSPQTVEEVSRVVAYANQQKLAIVPRGNGTKLGIGGIPRKVDLILSTLRLNKVTDNDCENLTLSVQGGMTLHEVQAVLGREGKGYFLPLDPPHSRKATLGGIVATNSSGPKRLLYGTARDVMIGAKAVFPNGDVVVSGGKTVKNVSGYDLCKLLIGSYGTLGILCEMTFKLLPLPEREETLWIPFPTLEEAGGFIREVMGSQLIPSSLEVLNPTAAKKISDFLPPPPGHYLVAIGAEGFAEGVDRQVSELRERAKRYGASGSEVLDPTQQIAFWSGLRDFSEGVVKSDPKVVSLKANVLISTWSETLGRLEKMANESGVDCAIFSHSGNGILYLYLFPGKGVKSKPGSLIDLIGKMTTEAVKQEGNLVVESAPLSIRKQVEVWGRLRDDHRVVRQLKEQIDPAGVFNPGRFLGGI